MHVIEKSIAPVAVFLSGEDLNVAASLLFKTYQDDAFFQYCFNASKTGYEQRLRAAIREELTLLWNMQQPIIGIYEGDEHLIGVACVTTPDNKIEPERFWHWRIKMMLTTGYVSTKQMIEKDKMVRASLPYKHYHLLSFIAVPSLQANLYDSSEKSEITRTLIGAIETLVMEDKHSEGVGILLSVEHYKTFFEQAGYQTIKQITIGDSIEADSERSSQIPPQKAQSPKGQLMAQLMFKAKVDS